MISIVVANTLVILTVLINKPIQTTLSYLSVNLAVADITFALFIYRNIACYDATCI